MTGTIADLNSTENQLLRVLPENENAALFAQLEPVELSFRQILGKTGEATEYVYFPLNSIVSLISTTGDDKTIELAMIGSEGVTGIQSVFGVDLKLYETIVQVPGKALRIRLEGLRKQLETSSALTDLLMRYLSAFYVQTAQSGTCGRLHKIEQRLQTWLMMMFNRSKSDELCLTQDDIANALGYRRPSLAEASIALQKKGIIQYSRGRIRLLDRQRLKANACECYDIMETQYDKIFVHPAGVSFKFASKKINFGVNDSDSLKLSAEKSIGSLNDHYQLSQSTIERIRRSCAATEAHCRRQIELLNQQRADLKLME